MSVDNLKTLQICQKIKNNRTHYSVFSKIVEEVGELAVEIAIIKGDSYKTAGSDGVEGEAIDVIASCIDLIYIHLKQEHPDWSIIEIDKYMGMIMDAKLHKWQLKVIEQERKNAIQ
jgi:hypothetical protein